MKKFNLKIFILTCISLFFFSTMASAHVTVLPKISSTGAWETYTVKVPVEKDSATTKIAIKVPAGIEIISYQPIPGWKYSAGKDASGKAKTITFEATGEGILPGQFQQFMFVAKNPDQPAKAAWDAFQYYKDGSIVEWTGDEGSDSPHAITDIVTGTSAEQGTHETQENNKKAATETLEENEGNANNTLPLILSGIALLLSVAALILSFRKKL